MVRVRDHLTGRDPAAPVLGESRSRVLAALQDAAQPLGVDEVAARVRLHPNTIRFHLDALVEAELAERVPEERRSPGRPRALYVARPGSVPAGSRSYRFLAQILASYIAAQTADPVRAATEAGQEWGRYLAGRPPPFHRSDAESAIGQLVDTLDRIGFVQETVTSGETRQIRLHHCPFREVAAEHGDVVCSVHLGLMRGLLAELDAPIEARRLEPFVEPSLCIAYLSPTGDGTGQELPDDAAPGK